MEYFNQNQINQEFMELTPNARVEVLMDALNYMKQHNNRSRILCIALAMGYQNYEGREDSYYKEDTTSKLNIKSKLFLKTERKLTSND